MPIIIEKISANAIFCPTQLQDAINADVNITTNCISVTVDGGVDLFLEFTNVLTIFEDTSLDALIAIFVCDTTTISIIDRGYLGNIWQASFANEKSSIKNMWLSHYGDNSMSSNKTPVVVPFKSKLIGIAMANKHNNVDTIIKLYSTPEGGGISPKTVDFSWTLNNVRVARKTDFTTDIIFDAGDKIAVYVSDIGKDPAYMVVDLYFSIIEETFSNGLENYTGEFKVGDGGGSQ